MSKSLPTIHKRADRELFFCYTTEQGKRIKKYLGKTKEEAENNLLHLFTSFTNSPTPPHSPSTPLHLYTNSTTPIATCSRGGLGLKTPHKPQNSPIESDLMGSGIKVSVLMEEYQKAYKLTHKYRADINRIGLVKEMIERLFPNVTVDRFGVRQMVMVRDYLCGVEGRGTNGQKYSVEYVNKILNTIRKAYKWGSEYELVDYEQLHKVQSAPNVRKGTMGIADYGYENVVVDDEVFHTVLDFVDIQLYKDILLLLRSTACRPSELLSIRGKAVEKYDDRWDYRPENHKTKAKGKERLICFNVKEIELLKKYVEKDDEKYWFSPSKIRGEVSDRPLDSVVVSKHLRWAIQNAIKNGAIQKEDYFTLYSLRKSGITEMVKKFGIEVASKLAGHSNIATTDRFYNRSDVFVIQSVASRR